MTYLSVCSGIEAATLAAEHLGWRPWAFAEIDAFPRAVLAHYYPETPNLGDITRYAEWPDAAVDLLVGGTPCQSFSVAGLGAGLDDPRGGLLFAYLAIARRYRPRWVVWENVPGVLSNDDGRAFGTLLGGLAELGYGFAFRVLDAQYFRLAQRRKRMFVVGHLGDWRRAAAVLFERASLSGHPAPRREATEDVAGTLGSRTEGGGSRSTDLDGHGAYIAGALTARAGRNGGAANDDIDAGRLIAYGGNNTSGSIDLAPAVLAKGGTGRHDFASEAFIAHTLTGEGFDASEDGGQRGIPLVPMAFHNRQDPDVSGEVTHPLGAKDNGLAVAYALGSHAGCADGDQTNRSHAGGGPVGMGISADLAHTVRSEQRQRVSHGTAVRRLTPLECERLQGFPDHFTRITYGKRGRLAKDGPRYKALGNSMAVPVMRWIFSRIAAVDLIRRETA